MSGDRIPESARPVVAEMARREDRVVIRVSPEFSFYTPPVHLNAGDDGSTMQHGSRFLRPTRWGYSHVCGHVSPDRTAGTATESLRGVVTAQVGAHAPRADKRDRLAAEAGRSAVSRAA